VTRGPRESSRKCLWLCLYKTEVDEAKVGEAKIGEELFQFSAAFGSARHSVQRGIRFSAAFDRRLPRSSPRIAPRIITTDKAGLSGPIRPRKGLYRALQGSLSGVILRGIRVDCGSRRTIKGGSRGSTRSGGPHLWTPPSPPMGLPFPSGLDLSGLGLSGLEFDVSWTPPSPPPAFESCTVIR
jgi:hypothetical protein